MSEELELKYCESCKEETPHVFHLHDSSRHEVWYFKCTKCGAKRDRGEDTTGVSPIGEPYRDAE